jgi:tetratricopeptide (TPR) repeat protein
MNDRIDENSITELGLALRKLENRIENNEAKQNTTAQRLEELYKTLLERLSAKDDTLVRIREQSEWTLKQNDTLLKQIGLRWNLLTALSGFVGLAFSIAFVYQIFHVEDVMRTQRQLESAAANVDKKIGLLDDKTDLLTKNTKLYSGLLSILAHADSLLTDSNREFLRAEYTVAAKRAGDAINILRSTLQTTGADSFPDLEKRQQLYVATTCGLNGSASVVAEKTTDESDTALSPAALRPTVKDALYTAYDVHARSIFFATPRGDTRVDGTMLLALNDNQWEGYHWIGLAAEEAGFVAEATECFRRSVDKNPFGNKDYVNLAELSFIHSNFPAALKYSDQYLHPINHRFKSSLDVIAQFYFSVAGFLANDAEALEKMPPETFRSKLDGLPDFTLQGTFSTTDLERYLASKEFSEKVSPDQKHEVLNVADCLIKRKCKT